jgi:hypothetical protein
MQPRTTAKDFFINLGAIVGLYTVVISLINLLFTVINKAYPQVSSYNYYSSSNISWPVAILIIFFPIFVLLMWVLEKGYITEPEKRGLAVKRWLTYITLFLAGLVLAGDLVTVLYFFIDGRDLTASFLLKALSVLVTTGGVFAYYISDIKGKLNTGSQKVWAIVAGVVVLASIAWGFSVLGSPRTQRLYKYDEQKVSNLQNLSGTIENYYYEKQVLPTTLADLTARNYGYDVTDPQSNTPYIYTKVSDRTYKLCATFNKDSEKDVNGRTPVMYADSPSWAHPAGEHCFERAVSSNQYGKPVPVY